MLLLREVNGGLTLLGIYETYKSKMPEIYGWNSETAQTYDRNYYEVLAPKFYKKAFVEYTIDDIISILDEIQNDGYIEEGKKKKYSDSQIRTFKSNIRRIDDIAVRNKIRLGSVFYGSIFELDDYKVGKEKNFYTNVEKITQKNLNENTVLKKSLTEEEEEKVFKSVMCDYKQIGDNMGIALMYACGLRNAEACGVNFGDIIAIDENEDSFVVRIKGTTNSSREETLQTKTENAYRYIPLSEKTFNLLINRKEYVKSKLNISEEKLNQLPIACHRNNYKKRCITKDLTEAGKKVLYDAGVNGKILTFIGLNNKNADTRMYEKEPTAYLFRRNFGTIMYEIGLNMNEIEYVMGHRINSIKMTRNRFNNPDLLKALKQKMDNRPFFSKQYPLNEEIILNEKTVVFNNPYNQRIEIPNNSTKHKVLIDVEAKFPNDSINVNIKTDSKTPIEVDSFPTVVPYDNKNEASFSVLRLIHKRYGIIEDADKKKNPEED